ncbi:hypothetical protein HYY75_00065 [bacterium]|nr:hypothetical protein [bacterium]
MINSKFRKWLAVLILVFFLPAQFVSTVEGSIWEKIKGKATKKIELFKQKDWLFTKIGGKIFGFVTGKAAGLFGIGVGAAIGFAFAGPLGASIGAWLGYRFFDLITRTFFRPVGELVFNRILRGQPINIKSAFKNLDTKELASEGLAVFVGDIIGEVLGILAGITLLSGIGPIGIPILGALSGAYIGKKLGRALGGWFGRFVGRKVAKMSLKDSENKTPILFLSEHEPILESEKKGNDSFPTSLIKQKNEYEKAYKAYVLSQSNSKINHEERNRLFQVYQKELAAFRAISSDFSSK